MSTLDNILPEAHRLAEKSKTWADLSNALFDPLDGLLARYIKSPSDRAEFRKSDAYGKLHSLVEQKMKQTGVAVGSGTPGPFACRNAGSGQGFSTNGRDSAD